MKTAIAMAFIAASLLIHGAQAQQAEQRPKRTVLQKSDVGTTGREVTMQIIEFAPGAAEVPHSHPGELIAYVLEGVTELDVAGKPTATYRAGDSFLVEGGRVHAGRNTGTVPNKALVVIIFEKGKPSMTPAK